MFGKWAEKGRCSAEAVIAVRRIQMIVSIGLPGPIMFLLASCQPSIAPVGLESFSDPDPMIRISAMKWAAENQVDEAIGPLVESLADEDAAVRFFAIQTLVRITGKDYGYDYKANARRRVQAISRWRESLKDTALASPASQLEPSHGDQTKQR